MASKINRHNYFTNSTRFNGFYKMVNPCSIFNTGKFSNETVLLNEGKNKDWWLYSQAAWSLTTVIKDLTSVSCLLSLWKKIEQAYYRMASSGASNWKQWWRSLNTCCSKKILLLLIWSMLFKFSENLSTVYQVKADFYLTINFISLAGVAPIVGWLADVRFGRYEIIKFGSLISFATSVLFYLEFVNGQGSTQRLDIISTLRASLPIIAN